MMGTSCTAVSISFQVEAHPRRRNMYYVIVVRQDRVLLTSIPLHCIIIKQDQRRVFAVLRTAQRSRGLDTVLKRKLKYMEHIEHMEGYTWRGREQSGLREPQP